MCLLVGELKVPRGFCSYPDMKVEFLFLVVRLVCLFFSRKSDKASEREREREKFVILDM